MTSNLAGRGYFCAGLVAAIGLVGMSGAPTIVQQAATPTMAQYAAEQPVEEIKVYAPIERRRVRSSMGGWTEEIELTRRVNFADLDLARYADVTELRARIETTATEACTQLDEMFPLDTSGRDEVRRCTRKAISGAEEQVLAAITAANARSERSE